MQSIELARQWRAEQPQERCERQQGVVLIWHGEVYGWKNCLRNPEHERPGALAVDEHEHVYLAEGGNDYDGAEQWTAVRGNKVSGQDA